MRSDLDMHPQIARRFAREPLVPLSVHHHRRSVRNAGGDARDHPDRTDPAPASRAGGTGGVEQRPLSAATPARTREHHVPVAPEPAAGAVAGGALDSLGRRLPDGAFSPPPAGTADLPAVHAQPDLLALQRLAEGDPLPGVDVGIGVGGAGLGALGSPEDLVEGPLLLRGFLAEVEPGETVVDALDPGGRRFRPAVPVVFGTAVGIAQDLEGPLNLPETLLDDAVVGVQVGMEAPGEPPVRLPDPQEVCVAPDPEDRVVVGGRGHG